jgi:TolB-like protein/tRNA A-37 threonylcarbamoyl transferase component Bud32/Tfp pilus assembly protein PilF
VEAESGRCIGKYQILELLGAGGMGEVYRAFDPHLMRDVAVKVLHADVFTDPMRRRRLEQEARAAGALNHPNLLTIFELGTHDDAPFIVSEILEGQTLRSVLAKGPLSVRDATSYAQQIAAGLEAAHDKGVVHRDLKPENIFITPDGRVKILDFGLAKLHEQIAADDDTDTAFMTEPGAIIGTLTYMSPEQVNAHGADARSDIFAVGAILFEMLQGRPAFYKSTPVATIAAILNEDPLESTAGAIPPPLAAIVRHCIEKDPERRFQTAHDLAFALRSDFTTSGVEVRLPAPSRSRRLFLISALVAIAAMVLIAVSTRRMWWPARSAGAKVGAIAVLPLADLTPGGDRDFAEGLGDELTTRLAQIQALRVVPRSSTSRYAGTKKSLRDIAQELDVDAILTGSVQRSNDRVRVRMQMADGESERTLWADQFERPVGDLLGLQDDLANAIADRVRAETSHSTGKPHKPASAEAQDAYLRGRSYYNRSDAESYSRAALFFKDAIRRDPEYASAYAGLADSYHQMAFFGMLLPTEAYPPAKEAALTAIRLGPDLADAHISLGIILTHYDWDWKGAEEHFLRAIALNPSSERAEDEYGLLLIATGRTEEAIKHARRAVQLSPLGRQAISQLPWMYYLGRRYAEAIAEYQRSMELDPEAVSLRESAADAYAAAGRDAQAFAQYQQWARMAGYPQAIIDDLASAYTSGGMNGYWKKRLALEEAEEDQTGDTYPYRRAALHARLHDAEGAMDWLERAYREHHERLIFLRVDPAFDPIRRDPRFQNLLRRIALPN